MFYEISSLEQYCVNRPHAVLVILSDEKNSIEYWGDFYSYHIRIFLNASVKNGALYEVACWCEENCLGAWLAGKDVSAFVEEVDAMAFKLRWT